MPDTLVIVATYGNTIEANLARNYLEAAGIRAFLSGEETAGIVWQFTNTVGDIQLLVSSQDADAARTALEERLADQQPPPAIPKTGIMTATDHQFDAIPDVEEPEPQFSLREQDAKRTLKAAVLGLLFFPIQFYATYLLFKVYLSDLPIRTRCVWQAWLAGLINVAGLVVGRILVGRLLDL